ncbi:E3 ubiquitin-protein ligase HECTD3 isoform X2 [Lingula anatina]|uniref:E3 ubiquitin-protein ligase HECTD3 isoform X2 n=1 Tax=Lingula anatina TaxID=7574 RepID=A0A1S3IYH2_LINAN|nr:E3 ubiquitin-protein ligase HECTD3 isoform X2 [Lingula anatina]|eukprot:XP_013403036.1 E3 ubiquitin-protein ligase HECTD3 isoform X2 [Lingula anatina]
MSLDLPRRRLGRIRCLQQCILCFKEKRRLPESLCYVPARIEFKATGSFKVYAFEKPSKQSGKVTEILCESDTRIVGSGEEFCNSEGQWIKIIEYYSKKSRDKRETLEKEAWALLFNNASSNEEEPSLIQVEQEYTKPTPKELIFGCKPKVIDRWEDVVEDSYSLRCGRVTEVAPPDMEAVKRLQTIPPNWSIDYDEELVKFLTEHAEPDNDHLGSVRNYVESIEVSSFCDDDGCNNLTDGDSDTFWESDGNQGQHWIRLKMKKGTVIKKLLLTVDGRDDNYMPYHIIVMGGEGDNLSKLEDIHLDQNMNDMSDVCVLENMQEHYPIIEIRIKECKDGIDTRIHGIKIKSSKERDLGLSKDLFSSQDLVRYPKLENVAADLLYRRAIGLQRFITIVDSTLPFILPAWEYSAGSFSSLEVVRQLLPLSKKRLGLIETFLRESETGVPSNMPKLYINRRAAMEHRQDPSLDPEYKNSVFYQIYEGLKPRDRYDKQLDYRWPSRNDQWWECKFLSEGIIDQGGGFRDSLSDMSDELCPSASDVPVPLPFFIRSPNQAQDDLNVNRDVYIPNPSCQELAKYRWIGKIMGACLRGKESLVLSLPQFIWKKLSGETVHWSRDYVTVDAAEVRVLETMETLDQETFEAHFGEDRTWTTVLSDGTPLPLKSADSDSAVQYEDRVEYIKLVQEARMNECEEQVAALREGLLSVVPQAVLDLLTWQELEKRICGDPEITVEALRKTTHYEDLEQNDSRVKYLWEALGNFSNEDRSRFLRFVTGRRRLPAPLYVCPDKGEAVDGLPESSTCSNTLYLPNYSSAKIAEEKLRYASYNCVAIDTDMSPWDE